jgi:hypothetical protein
MPNIVLKITHAPSEMEDHEPRRGAGPLFRGNGDTDYLCGNCGFAIASGMAPGQHVIVHRATCSACGALNEFPLDLLN